MSKSDLLKEYEVLTGENFAEGEELTTKQLKEMIKEVKKDKEKEVENTEVVQLSEEGNDESPEEVEQPEEEKEEEIEQPEEVEVTVVIPKSVEEIEVKTKVTRMENMDPFSTEFMEKHINFGKLEGDRLNYQAAPHNLEFSLYLKEIDEDKRAKVNEVIEIVRKKNYDVLESKIYSGSFLKSQWIQWIQEEVSK